MPSLVTLPLPSQSSEPWMVLPSNCIEPLLSRSAPPLIFDPSISMFATPGQPEPPVTFCKLTCPLIRSLAQVAGASSCPTPNVIQVPPLASPDPLSLEPQASN